MMIHNLKMYIFVKDDVPPGFAHVAIAHAALKGYLDFKDHPDTREWLETSFRKVVCKVDVDSFELLKSVGYCSIVTESALDGKEVALVFKPRKEWPECFNKFPLYK